MISPETAREHRVRWFAVDPGTGERIPRTGRMNGADWGWDAVCSCGYDTRTGGAIQQRIRDAIFWHRWEAEHGFDDRWSPRSVLGPDGLPVSLDPVNPAG